MSPAGSIASLAFAVSLAATGWPTPAIASPIGLSTFWTGSHNWPTAGAATAFAMSSRADVARPSNVAHSALLPIPHGGPTPVVTRYLNDLAHDSYDHAFTLLNAGARRYYGDVRNFRSIYVADAYRLEAFRLLGIRPDGGRGSLYFARERARFRDHAHDVDLVVTATVPLGAIFEAGHWRIKDPGHPRRAFASGSVSVANGLRVTVKKISFFAHRIEAVVTFANESQTHITLLPYGKSILHDAAGNPYRIIETRDWSLTDRTLFEGLRLPPNSRYTGTLTFANPAADVESQTLSLTIAPLMVEGSDAPFAMDIVGITAPTTGDAHAK